MPTAAFIGIGANLGDPQRQVLSAIDELHRLEKTRVGAVSALYRSTPMGPQDQPDYINAVCMLETGLTADMLLAVLQAIETRHGRIRSGERWGPRTLDLDILLYGDQTIDSPHLRIPHPGLAERDFVLHPLAEIAPGLQVPGLGPIAELLRGCPGHRLKRLDPLPRVLGLP